jgi:hydroxyacylglutathione hydrolase
LILEKKEEIAKGHVPNSLHIENGRSFSTWMGSLVDYQQQMVLITDEKHREDLTRKVMRIGMDNIYGFVIELDKMNIDLEKSELVPIDELKKLLSKKKWQFIDVRTETEYKNGHIKGVENMVLTSLEKNLDKISKDKPVIVHCQSGVRGTMAYSILRRNGFDKV